AAAASRTSAIAASRAARLPWRRKITTRNYRQPGWLGSQWTTRVRCSQWRSAVDERPDPSVEGTTVVTAYPHLDDLDPAVGRGQRLLQLRQRLDPPVRGAGRRA